MALPPPLSSPLTTYKILRTEPLMAYTLLRLMSERNARCALLAVEQESKRTAWSTKIRLPLCMKFMLNSRFPFPWRMEPSCGLMCIDLAHQGTILFWWNASPTNWRDGAAMPASFTPVVAMWSSGKMSEDALPLLASLFHSATTDGAAIETAMTRSCGQENDPGQT